MLYVSVWRLIWFYIFVGLLYAVWRSEWFGERMQHTLSSVHGAVFRYLRAT